MKNKYVYLITFVALVSILFLQGIWLYNSYSLLEAEFKKDISNIFIHSVMAEGLLRVDDPAFKPTDRVIRGFKAKNDDYTNNKALHDWLYEEKSPPILLVNVDSIFNDGIKKDFENMNYSFLITDSLGNQAAFLNHRQTKLNERFPYKETIQLRNIAPEYITLTIASPYKIIFGKMILMLIASAILAIIVIYGLILQINTIRKQKKIAQYRQDFTHAMIHDMKNPITTILLGINSLKIGKKDDKPQQKEQYYAIISRAGNHILKLVNEVLKIAQFEGDKIMLSKQQIDLSDLLGSLKEKYIANTAKTVNFDIELNNVENIYADLHYIHEAFDNLLENAIKYSKPNEEVDIKISSNFDGNNTQIIFKDKGIGIPEKDQKKIFQKFERSMSVINSKNKISGFGLGLNFVYQVIKAHSGSIKVNSRWGSYSEFIINIPYKNGND
jgi:two-component system phosphate regulon sensor histidine kinase PhoR